MSYHCCSCSIDWKKEALMAVVAEAVEQTFDTMKMKSLLDLID